MQAFSPGSPSGLRAFDLTAASDSRARVTLLLGTPTTNALPRSMRMSAGAASSSSAATACAFCFTSRAVWATAGPELAMTRLPPVPMPKGNCVVSPACTMTSSKSAPSSSAAICARVVAWPWPCAVTPMKT